MNSTKDVTIRYERADKPKNRILRYERKLTLIRVPWPRLSWVHARQSHLIKPLITKLKWLMYNY